MGAMGRLGEIVNGGLGGCHGESINSAGHHGSRHWTRAWDSVFFSTSARSR